MDGTRNLVKSPEGYARMEAKRQTVGRLRHASPASAAREAQRISRQARQRFDSRQVRP